MNPATPTNTAPVAELRPVGRPAVRAEVLLQRWRALPHVEPERLRLDLDELLDPSLWRRCRTDSPEA